jgi:hypothetical protein
MDGQNTGVPFADHISPPIPSLASAEVQQYTEGPSELVFASLLLFVIIRGFAEAEPFDLLLPLWSIVMLGVLCGPGWDCRPGNEHGVVRCPT